jgi:hypothetical protein
MAYNIKKVQDNFSVMNGEKKASQGKKGPPFAQWKPMLTDEGKARTYNVRFLPYQDQNEQPFQELAYYDNKALSPFRLVAPAQFGLEDPIAVFVTELRKQRNNKQAWNVIKGLLPKPRYFAPVLVREELDKGVQIWELSPTVCKEIYAILVSEDYRDEDVTSPDSGHDFQVTVSASGKTFTQPGTGKVYPVNDVKVMIRPKQSKLAKTEAEAGKLVESIPNLQDIFQKQVKPASELQTMLEGYLAVDAKAENVASANGSSNTSQEVDEATEAANDKSIEEQFAGL